MIVVCPSCSSRFQYPDARFQGAAAKRFKCPRCGQVFEVINPSFPPSSPPAIPEFQPASGAFNAPRPTETTARKERDAMLAAAGLATAGMPKDIRYSLAFLTGPQASTVRVLDTPVTVIGREEGDVIINDPEIPRRHARVEIHADGTVWLCDLDSTNGTSTGGRRLEGPAQLMDRQEFTCGKSTLMLLIRTIDSMSPD
jgi:predicted Zn finger-like uncharacterized protein